MVPDHACLQSYLKFAADTRKQAEMFCESEIIVNFGRFFIEDCLGSGARGEVHKVHALEGSLEGYFKFQKYDFKNIDKIEKLYGCSHLFLKVGTLVELF